MTQVGVLVHAGKQLGEGLEILRGMLAAAGHGDPPWREVPKSKKAPDAILELADAGVDRLLVWGGDGTVRRTIHTLLDAGADHVEIGILPAGTANLLARNLGTPIDLDGAVEVALHGEPKPIDVASMNDEHFAVSGGTGFDAMLISDVERNDLKDRWGRLAHLPAAWHNLRVPPAQAVVDVDGEPWYAGPATLVLVGNVPTTLGGLNAFPDARPDDGMLDVAVVRAHTRLEWLQVFASIIAGRTAESSLGATTTGRDIDIALDRTLPWQVDGGDRERDDRYAIRCVPSAIRICQPSRSSP